MLIMYSFFKWAASYFMVIIMCVFVLAKIAFRIDFGIDQCYLAARDILLP